MVEIQNILNNKKLTKRIVVFYHLLFCILTINYTVSFEHESDAERIFRVASNSDDWESLWGLGTIFICFLIYPLIKLGINYYLLTVIFSLISLKGYLIYIDLFFSTKSKRSNSQLLLFILFLFIPSLHYWTCFMGKDAVVFFLMAVILKGVFDKKYITIYFLLSALMILVIRPYLLLIIALPYSISFLFNSTISIKNKKKIFVLLAILGLSCIPILQKFFRIDTISLEAVNKSYEKVILYSQNNGNSSIDLQNTNYFERLFLVLFRPLFYDAKTTLHIIASIESFTIWVMLFKIMYSIKKLSVTIFKKVTFPVLVSILLVLFYSIYMYNLGLASRMRIMFLPYIIFSLFWILEEKKKIA